MDVYNDGKRIVGPDRAISQNADRFRTKRTLDVDLARRDVGQVWCRKRSSAMRAHQHDAASRFRRSATPEATARAHHAIRGRQDRLCSWLAAASVWGQNGMAAAAWRQVSVDFAYRLKRPDTQCAQAQETIHGGLARLIPCRRRRPRTEASDVWRHNRRDYMYAALT